MLVMLDVTSMHATVHIQLLLLLLLLRFISLSDGRSNGGRRRLDGVHMNIGANVGSRGRCPLGVLAAAVVKRLQLGYILLFRCQRLSSRRSVGNIRICINVRSSIN